MSTNAPARPQSSRRTLLTAALAGLAAGGATYAVRASGGSATAADLAALPPLPDPVFAAIATAKARWVAYGKAIRVRDEPETDDECDLSQEEADTLAEEAMLAWVDAEDALFTTVPTTAAGFVAQVEAWWSANVVDYGYNTDDSETVRNRLENDRELRQIKALIGSGRAFLAANGGRRA